MGVRFAQTAVTIAGTPWETFDPDARLTARCVWSPAVIRWGYDDSLDDPSPSTLSLPVTVPDGHALPAYGDRVVITTRYQMLLPDGTVDYTSDTDLVQFAGEVDGARITRITLTTPVEERAGTPRVEGWAVELTASGDIARLGRMKLADEPWPEELWGSARAPRIAALVAPRIDLGTSGSSIVGNTGGNYWVRGRDVDAFSALEAIRLGVAPEPNLLYDTDGPQLVALAVLPTLLRESAGGPAWIERYETDPTATQWVSAYAIEDAGRELNVGSVVNRATVRYPVPDVERPGDYVEATYSTADPGSADLYGPSEWRLDTDALDAPDVMADRLRRGVAARATEQWTLPNPARFDLARFHSPHVFRLLPSHAGSPVMLTETPPDVDRFQRSIGGTLTLHGDPDEQGLEVTLEPARNAVTEVLAISSLSEFPLDTLTAVTIRDLGDVSDAQLI